MNREKVVVGMSGGVDSSVAAYLLKEEGYEVIGATFDFWHDCDKPADIYSGLIDAQDAKKVADHIGIEHRAVNYTKEFRAGVEDYFAAEYLRGRTPNPCVRCNTLVKWEAMLRVANEVGARYVATGHYARVDLLENGRYSLKNSVSTGKDQTYALCLLTQAQLSRTLMPIGDYEKRRVREIARNAGLPVAEKAESQEICFVDDDDYAAYIDQKTGKTPEKGNFVDKNGKVLGTHKGITHYTIGQRRGLEIAAGHRIFVTEIRPETNEVVLGENEELFVTDVFCDDIRFMAVEKMDEHEKRRVLAKIRYNHKGDTGELEYLGNGRGVMHFERPQRAATPGQALVFYDGDYVLGAGTIYVN